VTNIFVMAEGCFASCICSDYLESTAMAATAAEARLFQPVLAVFMCLQAEAAQEVSYTLSGNSVVKRPVHLSFNICCMSDAHFLFSAAQMAH